MQILYRTGGQLDEFREPQLIQATYATAIYLLHYVKRTVATLLPVWVHARWTKRARDSASCDMANRALL
jgi:hypothetical protein